MIGCNILNVVSLEPIFPITIIIANTTVDEGECSLIYMNIAGIWNEFVDLRYYILFTKQCEEYVIFHLKKVDSIVLMSGYKKRFITQKNMTEPAANHISMIHALIQYH